MKVAVVLVNYGRWDLTDRCVESLRKSRGVEISMVLVDNDSPGGVPPWADEMEDVRLLKLDENIGFAGGNNAGFREATREGAELVFFLNNDALVMPDTVARLARFMKNRPEVGIAAPAVFLESDPGTIWSAGGKLVPWKMRYEQVDFPGESADTGEGLEVDFVSGCAMMVRSELFEKLGGFREDFFMYYEDAEFCGRARRAGAAVMVLPSATVLHDVAASSGGELSPLALYYSERNRLLLAGRVLSPFERAVFLLYKTLVAMVLTVKLPLTGHRGLSRWIWRGYLDGLTGKTGRRNVPAAVDIDEGEEEPR